ncbi:MAG: hypothetical protein AB7P69_00215 [Candidatus Binatia bacterium]
MRSARLPRSIEITEETTILTINATWKPRIDHMPLKNGFKFFLCW